MSWNVLFYVPMPPCVYLVCKCIVRDLGVSKLIDKRVSMIASKLICKPKSQPKVRPRAKFGWGSEFSASLIELLLYPWAPGRGYRYLFLPGLDWVV